MRLILAPLDNEQMTDRSDKNQPDSKHTQPLQPPDDMTKASSDLSNVAEEARQLLNQSQKDKSHKTVETTSTEAVVAEDGNTTNDLQQEALKAIQLQAERQREAEEKARSAVETRSSFTEDMRLKLESSEGGDAIIKTVDDELIVGRADNVTDYVPDIDLTPHGAYRLGLSRRHASILREGERLLVKDLHSRNGTFVNGAIVPGGGTTVIRDGDQLRFGNLAMYVSFET